MKYYFVNRQRTVIAKNASALVRWMRRHDFQESKNVLDFMEQYAHRKKVFENINISHICENTFVDDLVSNNIIKIQKQNNLVYFLHFPFFTNYLRARGTQ